MVNLQKIIKEIDQNPKGIRRIPIGLKLK